MQMGRGAYHTPGAMNAKKLGSYILTRSLTHSLTHSLTYLGKDWDEEKGEWVLYDLKNDANTYLSMTDEQYIEGLKAKFKGLVDEAAVSDNAAESTSSKGLPRREVRDMSLYDTLGNSLTRRLSLTYLLTYSLTHLLTHSLTYSPTHLLTQVLRQMQLLLK
jgi:hypothetical protein